MNKRKEISEHLKLNSDLELMAVIMIGYPDEDMTTGTRKILEKLIM